MRKKRKTRKSKEKVEGKAAEASATEVSSSSWQISLWLQSNSSGILTVDRTKVPRDFTVPGVKWHCEFYGQDTSLETVHVQMRKYLVYMCVNLCILRGSKPEKFNLSPHGLLRFTAFAKSDCWMTESCVFVSFQSFWSLRICFISVFHSSLPVQWCRTGLQETDHTQAPVLYNRVEWRTVVKG